MSKIVTLAEIENHDNRPTAQGKDEFRFLCCLSHSCLQKPADAAHRSLCVNKRTGAFFCHRCGAKGRLREFWEEKSKVEFRFGKKEKARLALQTKFAPPVLTNKAQALSPEKLAQMQTDLREWQRAFLNSQAQNYLRKRGIETKTAERFGCGYAANWEHWEKREGKWFLSGSDERVVFPVTDKSGKLVAVQARAISENFIGAEKLTRGDKSQGLFQPPDFFSDKSVAVAEGPVDAMALQQCGVPAVAMIGTAFPVWLPLALGFRSVLLATDADEAGDLAAAKLKTELLRCGARIFRLRPRAAKDWAEVLVKIGTQKLTQYLAPFSVVADDETKLNAAWRLFKDGRKEAAYFASKLIENGEYREWMLDKFRHLKAA